MALYRKKPVVIEATQWRKNGDHPKDYAEDRPGYHRTDLGDLLEIVITSQHAKEHGGEGQVVRYFRRPGLPHDTFCCHCGIIMHDHGWIDTLEGGHIVCPGDWIITGVAGEHYPCKPDIFEKTYVKEGSHIDRIIHKLHDLWAKHPQLTLVGLLVSAERNLLDASDEDLEWAIDHYDDEPYTGN